MNYQESRFWLWMRWLLILAAPVLLWPNRASKPKDAP